MNKDIFINFIRDKAVMTLGFFINSLLLILFFSLSVGSSVEILYPFIITFFIYLVIIVIEWIRYYKFNLNLYKSVENEYLDLQPSTYEQHESCKAITGIHERYIKEITEINIQNQNNRHFISQWIHNMKTPVSVIDLIIQKSVSENVEHKKALADINEENQRLHGILEQVLNILRLENFSKDYEPLTIDLVAAVKKVINNRKSQFIYNNVFPKLQCSHETMPVLSDSKWNEQMLDQLVSNAIKYSDAGESSKCVFFEIENADNRTLLKIKDEGIGIPPYDIKRVFEPFFTGENGRKYKNASGIGLYICSMISKKLGHDINIDSEPGKGTQVTVSYLSKL